MLLGKKITLAFLAFGSSALFAGDMGPVCSPSAATVPCKKSAWEFGAQALYLQPNYPEQTFYSSTVVNRVQTFQKMPYDWGWGFKLEGAYHFNTGNDVNLNWYHYDKTTNGIFPADITIDRHGHIFSERLNSGLKSKWDAVNLELGQCVDFAAFKNIRFHGGAQYARIENTQFINGTGALGNVAASLNETYNGFGPRIGADMSYGWRNGFSIYSNGAALLLVGTSSFTDTTTNNIANGIIYSAASSTVIVPELEVKLGVKYTYVIAQGDLSLDAGWMWLNYFNAQQDSNGANATNANPTVIQTDFSLQGPYVGLKWVGNMA